MNKSRTLSPGTFTLALRLVLGWTYFSAFWRRLVLENKLDAEAVGYIGEKFNHFFPHALFIKGPIEYLLLNPELLWWVMLVFTIVEGVTGLLYIFGLFTRTVSLIVMGLAAGILLSAGWIGTTCLDEWQIGIIGLAGGLTIFFSGGGYYSLDHYLKIDELKFTLYKKLSAPHFLLIIPIFVLFTTLATNQHFHGGVWGTLHNKSVSPELELSHLSVKNQTYSFEVMRTHGADVYGSFAYKLELIDVTNQNALYSITGDEFQKSPLLIENKYIAKIKSGAHALIIPLGASAKISFQYSGVVTSPIIIKLTDISGKSWAVGTIDENLKKNTESKTTLLNNAVIIDVRKSEEYQAGHLSHALNIPLEEIEKNPEVLNILAQKHPNSTFYFHCKTGIRAEKAKRVSERQGRESINIGGYDHLKSWLK